ALETRLADAEERTRLAQVKIEKRDIRLAELTARIATLDQALAQEQQLSVRAQSRVDLLTQQIAALRDQLSRLTAALDVAEAKVKDQKVEIAELGRRLNLALARKVEELNRYRSEFFGRLREVLGEHPSIRIVGDRFVFQSELLFPSASATLVPEGRRQLGELAKTLKIVTREIPTDIDWILRVDGHTDRRPIRTQRFPSNWELSTARALSVVEYLNSQGIPARRLAATGFGEFHPLDNASTPQAYARNRRIEIKLTQP
ncbi:MAG: peptidoglycan -binding protein, partial [Acidiferrobacterales bacterium]